MKPSAYQYLIIIIIIIITIVIIVIVTIIVMIIIIDGVDPREPGLSLSSLLQQS